MESSIPQPERWYERLLSISRQASDQADFEVAYHSLAAALHCVKDRQQERALIKELQALLEKQEIQGQELDVQVRGNREARLAQLHLAAIVSSSEDAILSKDLDGIVTSWNEGAERLYGYRVQEMVGQSVARIFPPDRQEELTHIMEQIRQGERVGSYETIRARKDGSVVPVSVTISPVKESDGTIIGASDIARDITLRHELEYQRAAFVDLVTHELKNPLTALSGNIQLAQRLLTRLFARQEQLNDEQQHILMDVLTMLGRSQQQMQVQKRLIDDLLDLSHVQQGTLELHLNPCNLLTVVYDTVQNHQAAYSSRLIELTLPAQDEVLVYADRDRLEQVLSNYLSNALKFAPGEHPFVWGCACRKRPFVSGFRTRGRASHRSNKPTFGSATSRSPRPQFRQDGRRAWGWASTFVNRSCSSKRGKWALKACPARARRSGFACRSISKSRNCCPTNRPESTSKRVSSRALLHMCRASLQIMGPADG